MLSQKLPVTSYSLRLLVNPFTEKPLCIGNCAVFQRCKQGKCPFFPPVKLIIITFSQYVLMSQVKTDERKNNSLTN